MNTSYSDNISRLKQFKLFGNEPNISASKDFLRSNSIIAKIAFFIFIIFIFIISLRLGIIILNYIFTHKKHPILIDGMVDAEQLLVIAQNPNISGSIPILRSENQQDGLEFTWSVWLWIKDPPLSTNPAAKPNEYKHVFHKGNDNLGNDGLATPNNAPGLYIGPNYRELVVVMNTFDNLKEEITISDIPIEKWINVIIRSNQKKLDVYINGTLTRSHTLNSVPKQNYDDVYVGLNGGFSGNLSLLQYFTEAIGIHKIQKIVDAGPNLKPINTTMIGTKPYYLSFKWFFPQRSDQVFQ